jgi:ADP-heptose:LPS heptosyltransferase
MKLLIIRFGAMGDIVLTSALIRCLHRQLDVTIHYLTKNEYREILSSNPYINNVHTIDANFWNVIQELQREKFDFVIDLHKSIRSYLVRVALMRKAYSYRKLRIKRWLRTKKWIGLSPDRHIALRYIETLKPLNVMYDGEGLDFFQDPEKIINVVKIGERESVALIVGAQHFTKRIPISLMLEFVKNRPEVTFYTIGGPMETELCNVLSSYDHVFNYCGKLNIQQSASVISQCDYVISGDTGMMHIAAALNKKILMVWGSTVKEFGFYPFYPNQKGKAIQFEIEGLECRPCTKQGNSKCPKGHFKCMNNHKASEILMHMTE